MFKCWNELLHHLWSSYKLHSVKYFSHQADVFPDHCKNEKKSGRKIDQLS